MHHGVNGTLYRTGEYILTADADDDDQQILVRAMCFFSVPIGDQHITFLKGELYGPQEGNPIHTYSSNPFVVPTSQVEVVPATTVLRKVMLYPDPDNLDSPSSYVVIDFNRPFPPIKTTDVIVPVYPEAGDMLAVCGEDGDIWYAKVLSVEAKNKTCQIHFYVEDTSNPGRYIRETVGRKAIELLHWHSIIHVASGNWEGSAWYIK